MRKADRLLAFLLLLQTITYAQAEEPRVGLVLSGGGAKALAHVGLLRVLEEEGATGFRCRHFNGGGHRSSVRHWLHARSDRKRKCTGWTGRPSY